MRSQTTKTSVLLLMAAALSCNSTPRRDDSSPEVHDGIALPSLDGFGQTRIGPIRDEIPGTAKWLRLTTVIIPAEGPLEVVGTVMASRWRGFAEQPFDGSRVMSMAESKLRTRILRLAVEDDGTITVSRIKCGALDSFRKTMARLKAENAFDRAGLWISRSVSVTRALRVMAILLGQQVRFVLVVNGASEQELPSTLYAHLKQQEAEATSNKNNLPNVALRIRADGRAPFGAVEDAVVTGMRSYHWRLSFVGLLDGQEVEVGDAWASPDEPAVIHEPIEKEVIFGE
jgi:hypothetical protein